VPQSSSTGYRKTGCHGQSQDKVTESAEHLKTIVTETTERVVCAATEAFHKSDHEFTDVAGKAKDFAGKTTNQVRRVAGNVADKPTQKNNSN
jgi:hypothetical protein